MNLTYYFPIINIMNIENKISFLGGLSTLLHSWGSDMPQEVSWGLNPMLPYIIEHFELNLNEGFKLVDVDNDPYIDCDEDEDIDNSTIGLFSFVVNEKIRELKESIVR